MPLYETFGYSMYDECASMRAYCFGTLSSVKRLPLSYHGNGFEASSSEETVFLNVTDRISSPSITALLGFDLSETSRRQGFIFVN